jgi:hypothetical protein
MGLQMYALVTFEMFLKGLLEVGFVVISKFSSAFFFWLHIILIHLFMFILLFVKVLEQIEPNKTFLKSHFTFETSSSH